MPPMFEIAEGDLPFVRTRQALLLLDLQNDFITENCLLPVENPPNFVENAVNLASHFRNSGNVIWFRSQFITSRVINDKTNLDSEFIITDNELPHERRPGSRGEDISIKSRPSSKLLERRLAEKVAEVITTDLEEEEEEEEEEDSPGLQDGGQEPNETFLTAGQGQRSRLALPESPGANLALTVVKALDNSRDLIFQKSHYSAFKDGHLIQTLRGKFVTEIFICGALSNISVFATAMDAARHGLAITLVEDCLGYRSKARHDEALRQLTDYTGCDVITSADLIKEIQDRERARARARERRPASKRDLRPGKDRKKDNAALEEMMRRLELDGSSAKNPDPVKLKSTSARPLTPQPSRPSAPAMPSHPLAAGFHGTIRDSFDDESTQEMVLPPKPEPQKKERVKVKIKSRRRPSNPPRPTGKQDGVSGEQSSLDSTSNPSTAITVQETSEALTKMSLNSQVTNSTIAVFDSSAAVGVPVEAKVQNAPTTESDGNVVIVTREPADLMGKQPSVHEAASLLCEGDTTVINELLSGELAEGIFEKVRDEVRWQRMSHQGGEVPRLVSVQGEITDDGSVPIYRHPADESPPLLPFSPTVSQIRKQVEEKLGHSVNHVLIQFYRNGADYISEHSDKTLDIVPGTFIANISLGAQRTMVFRTKKPLKGDESNEEPAPRKSCRAPLPHNSMCKMGLVTNMRWLHGIRQDKRITSEKSEEELAYGGGRISLTFRMIGTFLDKDQTKIWGQGAVTKAKESANTVINGHTPEAEEMMKAFGLENHSSEFDWKASYGSGFDVLHISNSRKLFLSGDFIADTRVKFMLSELGIDWTEGKLSPAFNWKDGNSHKYVPAIPEQLPVSFVDNDLSKSTVEGDMAILLYLDTIYGTKSTNSTSASHARIITRFFAVPTLLEKWRARPFMVKPFRHDLSVWNTWSTESEFIAGDSITIADFAVWPLLDEICRDWGSCQGSGNINAYYNRLKKLASLEKALDGRVDLGPLARPNTPRRESVREIKEEGDEKDTAPRAAVERG